MSGESVNNSCRNCGAKVNGCTRCGRPVATDALRVGVSFTPDEIERLARDATDPKLAARLLCALGTVDPDLARVLENELASTEPGCPSCVVLTEQLDALQAQIEEQLE